MKDESIKAESEHQDEYPEKSSFDIVGGSDTEQTADAPGQEVSVDPVPPETSFAETTSADTTTAQSANVGLNINHYRSSRRQRSFGSMKRKLDRATSTIRYQRIALLVLAGIGVFILLIAIGLDTSAGKRERALGNQLSKKDIEISKLRSKVEEQQASISGFINRRLPGLVDIEFDQVFEIEHPYVRNITFTRIRDNKNDGLEFHIVLENETVPIAAPAVDIILFSNLGLEIDRRKLRVERAVNTIEVELLSRGEVRSYVDSFTVQPDMAPAYFLIR